MKLVATLLIISTGSFLHPSIGFAKRAPCAETALRTEIESKANNGPRFGNDYEYFSENRRLTALGRVSGVYDPHFQTRFYYTSSAQPDLKTGLIPKVDPRSRGLYIFFHGSGTAKASGKNFADKMNELSKAGYSALGFDMPFHGDGPTSEKFNDKTYFFNWLHEIIQANRIKGQPVYLAGHSFGPDVIAEYLTLYPHDVSGAALISPAGFDPVLSKWYDEHTSKMDFGDTAENEAGGTWSDTISRQMTWNKLEGHEKRDPSVVNPALKIRILSGDHEEYAPAPLNAKGLPAGKNTYDLCKSIRRFMRNAECNIEPGVGHYIFLHADKNGDNVVMREMLGVDGKKPGDLPALQADAATRDNPPTTLLGQRYSTDTFFPQWLDREVGHERYLKILRDHNEPVAQGILKRYDEVLKARAQSFDEHIRQTQIWAPDFYARNQQAIEQLGKPKNNAHAIHNAYLNFLSANPEMSPEYVLPRGRP